MVTNLIIDQASARRLLTILDLEKEAKGEEIEWALWIIRQIPGYEKISLAKATQDRALREVLVGIANEEIAATTPRDLETLLKEAEERKAAKEATEKKGERETKQFVESAKRATTRVPPPTAPAPVLTPSGVTPGFSIIFEKAKGVRPAAPFSVQAGIRRLSFAPFQFLVKNAAPAIEKESPEKATGLSLVARGITPSKLAPLKTEFLERGGSLSQWNKLIGSMQTVPKRWVDIAEFVYYNYQLSISPALTGPLVLRTSADASSLVLSRPSLVGGIFNQIGTRLLGRATTSILGKMLGAGAGEAVGAGATAAATGAAAGATTGATAGAGIGATIGGPLAPITALIGAVGGALASKLIVAFQRNKEKIIGFLLIGAGGITAALGFGIGGLVLMGAGGLALLGSAAGGMAGAGQQVATFGGSILYGIIHVVVPSIATPLIIAFITIPVLVAFIFFVINNSAFVLPPSGGGGIPGGGIIPPGGIITRNCPVATGDLCSLNDSRTKLQETFGGQGQNAAKICLQESGGQTDIINDNCLRNPIYSRNPRNHDGDYSIGLFQINMLAHPNRAFLNTPAGASLKDIIDRHGGKTCYEAFSNYKDFQDPNYYRNGYRELYCEVADQSLLDDCVSWFQNPANNVAYANFKSKSGNDWSAWTTARKCGIVK